MNDSLKSREELLKELEDFRRQISHLETLLRRTENKLLESQQQLFQAQKMETLGTLVAGVAHEINNPINLIMYNLPLLQKTWLDFFPVLMERKAMEPDRKYGGFTYEFLTGNLSQLIADMDMAANRVAKTVSDLKNFSRLSNSAERSPVQVNTAVRNAIRLAQATLVSSGVNLELKLENDLPQIEANLQSIEQIVLNILINAVQAIDHRQGQIEINTGFQHKDGMIHISIRDNGRGISPRIAEKIFFPFVTDKQAEGGTGLGLSVTYSLVKAHAGDIVFESQEGQGATFTVFLPTILKRRAARILVVDDDMLIRRMLIEVLTTDHRYLVEEAANGIEASIKLGTYRPDLVILDIFMPEMDGLEVCRNIRNEPELAEMKVIITTGYPEHPKLDEIARLGFIHVFTKPFNLADFSHAVGVILTQ